MANQPVTSKQAKHEQEVKLLNVPNILCAMRLTGSPLLVALAVADQPHMFLALLIFLLFTDWIDGKLAILWNQRTTFGARLDSVADASMYAAMLFGTLWMKWEVVRTESVWLGVTIGSYVLTTALGFAKFRRMPSYHTRAAKTCWLLTSVAAVSLFAGWSVVPLRLAAAGVTITNLEAIAITWVLPKWRADVTSIYHAWRDTRNERQRVAT